MVRTASRTVAFCGGGVASAAVGARASGCGNELAIPSRVSVCSTIGTPEMATRIRCLYAARWLE